MATYDDFDGAWFTIQSLRLMHPDVLEQVSFLVVDNHPEGIVAEALRNLTNAIPDVRYLPFRGYRSTSVRDLIFRESDADIVLCVDSHVLVAPGGLAALLAHFDADPASLDIVQGPLIMDSLDTLAGTGFAPRWGAGMYGQWEVDDRVFNDESAPFEIEMMGLGLFACRKEAWPGINPRFRGFGGEEGYLHEKFRQQGGRALCLPTLGWMHRFPRPTGIPYPVQWEDRVRNYLLGWAEVGWDTAPVFAHFRELLQPQEAELIFTRTRTQVDSPLTAFDGLLVLDDGRGWAPQLARLADEALGWRAERIEASPSDEPGRPFPPLHAALIAASSRRYRQFIILIGADRLKAGAAAALEQAVADLPAQDWRVRVLLDDGTDGALAVAVKADAVEALQAGLPKPTGEGFAAMVEQGGAAGYLRAAADIAPAVRPTLLRQAEGLEVTEVDDGLVVFQPRPGRIHHLNGSAAIVFDLADGTRDVGGIATELGAVFALTQAPLPEVESCLATLRNYGILVPR